MKSTSRILNLLQVACLIAAQHLVQVNCLEAEEVKEAASKVKPDSGEDSRLLFAGSGSSTQRQTIYPEGEPSGKANQVAIGNPFGVEIQENQVWLTSVDDHCIYLGKLDGSSLHRVA
ncbi:MAG: hypothetical protein VX694_14190, partial [Planctomycetota bacterium]|nr:hypothetical protein [Planctomycetota bacterium]